MKVLGLSIEGFRGIKSAKLKLDGHTVLIGPNSAGKSTILDALSLTFGRQQLVRDLTEHDFFGSHPLAATRIRLVATLGGFKHGDPDKHDDWFRDGRGVPKWWNAKLGVAEASPSAGARDLCVQIGYAARFDQEDLTVESLRYFHDDDSIIDPFTDEGLQQVPGRLLTEIGFYVLPVRRTWESTVSFASDLFRKAVTTFGGVPAATLLAERDKLRRPEKPLEEEAKFRPLVEKLNAQMEQLLPQAPKFQLRVTATDSEALLRALVPHYEQADGWQLPAGRHGTGLLSLQTFILLLEIGRERVRQGLSFILAMEEPELHVAPGLQRRLVAHAVSIATQTICTSHSPTVAACYPATALQCVERLDGALSATPLLSEPLPSTATQSARKLVNDERARVVSALMQHRVLIPEGRTEFEWFRLLSDLVETANGTFGAAPRTTAPFGAIIGVVPTHNSAVTETYERLRRLRAGVVALVDGDGEGDRKITELLASATPPQIVLQWPASWTMEDAIGWILHADEPRVVPELKSRIPATFQNLDELITLFKKKDGQGRLKGDYLAYEEVASVIAEVDGCRTRATELLDFVTTATLGRSNPRAKADQRSTDRCAVMRFAP